LQVQEISLSLTSFRNLLKICNLLAHVVPEVDSVNIHSFSERIKNNKDSEGFTHKLNELKHLEEKFEKSKQQCQEIIKEML